MDMQDKDFDKLFSSKFEDFEAEPSAMVWENIAGELEGKKADRPWIAYLSIAAGIVAVFTAGWLFLQKDVQSGERHHNYANLVHRDLIKPVHPLTAHTVKQPEPVVVDSSSVDKTSVDRMASNSNHRPKTVLPANKVTAPVLNKADDIVKKSQPAVNADPQLMAHANAPVTASDKPIMPDVQLSPKATDAVTAAAPVEQPMVVISTETEIEEPVKRRRIHNPGGLLNMLISKVDKRPNKFIEFSDDEDDVAETSLTGVNMGPIKFKKQ